MYAPEPWLQQRHCQYDPIRRLLACSLDQSAEEIHRYVDPLTEEEIWHRLHGLGTVGFHLRHLAGSTDRLLHYALGGSLTEDQLEFLRQEEAAEANKQELLSRLEERYARVHRVLQRLENANYAEPRFVGRARLETPLGVLLGHIAEHTQRHTGQVILLAKAMVETRHSRTGQTEPSANNPDPSTSVSNTGDLATAANSTATPPTRATSAAATNEA